MNKKTKHRLVFTLSACILTAAGTSFSNIPAIAQASCAKANAYTAASSECANDQTSHMAVASAFVCDQATDDWNSEDLFAGYVNQVFHTGSTTASLKNVNTASKLTGQNRIIYNALKKEIAKVADGTRSSTEFPVSVSELLDKTTYSAAELGLSSASTEDAIANAIENKIFSFSLDAVMNSLILDCPYELYWYSRTELTMQYGPEYRLEADNGISFPQDAKIYFRLPVDSAYAVGTYTTDTSKTSAATTAAANAKAIVAAASGKSDYEKLAYYRQQICDLTSYNHAAAQGSVSNGSPWQMIYVFDGDSSTNVVCEGYAKAFQYLCDETVFSNANIYCYTVHGLSTSSMSTGSEPHMWNIVHMGSLGNYLVDVTNCDTGFIGYSDKLFLTGYTSGSPQSGYTIQIPAETRTEGNLIYGRPEVSVRYQYSDELHSIYTAEELTLTQGGILLPELVRDNETHSHVYETYFYWSDDLVHCSASLICRTNPAHAASDLDCSVSSQTTVPATCTAKGTAAYTARVSYDGTEFTDTRQKELNIDPANHTGSTQIQNARAATATQDGYTGDTYCSGCGMLIAKGTVIPAGKNPDNIEGSSPDNTSDSNSDDTPNSSSDQTSESNPDKNELDKITAKKASATIKKGKSIRFRFSSSLNMKKVKKITYKSTKKSIAKVSKKGKITGKKAGTATIKATITLKNGSRKTVSMKIKVRK